MFNIRIKNIEYKLSTIFDKNIKDDLICSYKDGNSVKFEFLCQFKSNVTKVQSKKTLIGGIIFDVFKAFKLPKKLKLVMEVTNSHRKLRPWIYVIFLKPNFYQHCHWSNNTATKNRTFWTNKRKYLGKICYYGENFMTGVPKTTEIFNLQINI